METSEPARAGITIGSCSEWLLGSAGLADAWGQPSQWPSSLRSALSLCLNSPSSAILLWGPSRQVYVGAFVVVSWLELLGTHLGTWVWGTHDFTGWVSIGNPPSGAAGGYGWFDLAGLLLAPYLVRRFSRSAPEPAPPPPAAEPAGAH